MKPRGPGSFRVDPPPSWMDDDRLNALLLAIFVVGFIFLLVLLAPANPVEL